MATTQTITLDVTLYANKTYDDVLWEATSTATVPVTRSEVDGIKERINQINAAFETATDETVTNDSPTPDKTALALKKLSVITKPDSEGTTKLVLIQKISGAKMTIVEKENVYDYRNA